jgi:predicted GTPase
MIYYYLFFVLVLVLVVLVSMSLRKTIHKSRSTRAIVSLNKDVKCLRQPTIPQLNMPWVLTNYRHLPDNMDDCKKIWIVGRYKVGKSSVLRALGVEDAEPANLQNTRGEIFLTDPMWPNCIFVDTEGFEQPIDTSEPEFRKHFIMRHAHKASDAIIVVVPMLITNDLILFTKSIKLLHGKNR